MPTEWLNGRSFTHHSHGFPGITVEASRCDFKEGVTVYYNAGMPADRLARALAEVMAWHAVNIRPQLNGFCGYDCIRYSFKRI